MSTSFLKALRQADAIRMDLKINMFESINIFDCCVALGLNVYLIDINMEGTYQQHDNGMGGNIILSSKRPLPRRCFTCAHELGHHAFKHGTKIDTISEIIPQSVNKPSDEYLVDTFAGALLMPIGAVEVEFRKRNWSIANAGPVKFYTIASIFGTGYATLVYHCKMNGLVTTDAAANLLKYSPAKIFRSSLPSISLSYFKIIDGKTFLPTIDLEVSNYIIFTDEVYSESDLLLSLGRTTLGYVYKAISSGITQISFADQRLSSFIRIQHLNYKGLVQYRHLS